MLQIHTQRKVEFVTVERETAWIVVAFLVEITGNEKKVLSGPKVVKVILKTAKALSGAPKGSTMLALPAPKALERTIELPLVSPFFSNVFGFSNSEFVISVAARPPTII